MKPMKAYEHFDDILKNELELDYMPPEVNFRLQQIYLELPDPLPNKSAEHSRMKAVYASLSAVAAAVLLLFGLNAVNPAFAEEIPLIGGFFPTNQRRGPRRGHGEHRTHRAARRGSRRGKQRSSNREK